MRIEFRRCVERAAAAIATVTAAIALLGQPAAAQSNWIGFIKTVQPDVEVLMDGQPTRAVPGMPLQKGAVVRTGPAGSLGITLRDNTLISLGPNTEFAIDDYQFEPAKGELRLWGSVSKGTLQYVSGMIAKLKYDAVRFRTHTGVVGVRGTRFVMRVDPQTP